MEKNMRENFEKLKRRVFDSLYDSDLEYINYEMSNIDKPTLVSGVGGSSVVALYGSKILDEKNNIITRCVEPRDFNYLNLDLYQNVLACSFSGNNYGVELAFNNDLNHYLLASKGSDFATNLTYNVSDKEKSFISLAATLIPCSILLNYYLDGDKERIIDLIDNYSYDFDTSCDIYEIFTGSDTLTASKYLESTMVESGIGIPIIHDKYSYCHGRSTTVYVNDSIAIYFDTGSELDKLLLSEIPKYYKDVVRIDSNSSLIGDYSDLIKCMYLTKYIAECKSKDLSGVDYNPIVKKLYKYNGEV